MRLPRATSVERVSFRRRSSAASRAIVKSDCIIVEILMRIA
jgi:hypothetical protein